MDVPDEIECGVLSEKLINGILGNGSSSSSSIIKSKDALKNYYNTNIKHKVKLLIIYH